MAKHNELGKEGEQAALEFLLQLGHELLIQNYRFSRAEIDIVTRDGIVDEDKKLICVSRLTVAIKDIR